jgi:hypothetical protein
MAGSADGDVGVPTHLAILTLRPFQCERNGNAIRAGSIALAYFNSG